MGNSETISALIDVMKYSEKDTYGNAAWALINIGNSEVVSALIELLNHSDWGVRGFAAQALGVLRYLVWFDRGA